MNFSLPCKPNTAASRRYTRRFIPTMAAYVVLILVITYFFKHHHPTGLLAYCLAVLPALPLIATIFITGLYLTEEQDEFQRTILIQSMLWGIGATLAVTTVWGFLEHLANVPALDITLIYPAFWFFVGVANPIISRRYR